jgi:hypothetical protein
MLALWSLINHIIKRTKVTYEIMLQTIKDWHRYCQQCNVQRVETAEVVCRLDANVSVPAMMDHYRD